MDLYNDLNGFIWIYIMMIWIYMDLYNDLYGFIWIYIMIYMDLYGFI